MGFFSRNLQMKNAKTRIQSVGVILATYKNRKSADLVGLMSVGSGQMAGTTDKNHILAVFDGSFQWQ